MESIVSVIKNYMMKHCFKDDNIEIKDERNTNLEELNECEETYSQSKKFRQRMEMMERRHHYTNYF